MRFQQVLNVQFLCALTVMMAVATMTSADSGKEPMRSQIKDIIKKGPYSADWESLKKHEAAPDWFRDAKFGIYWHWGVYSVPAFGSEWYPRNMHIKNRNEYRHHVETYGDPTEFGYHDFVPRFKAEKFDAEEWADLFEKAGAKFAGPVAEHHDGFAMWASKVTPWNARNMGPKRDLTGELEKAIRKRGMKFVATFHHARNSLHEMDKGGKKQWSGHYDHVKKDFPSLLDDPKQAILYGYMPREEFLEMWRGKLVEVIDNYRPDLIWFDSWLHEIPDEYLTSYLAYYFNRAHERGQDVVVTFKQKDLPQDLAVLDLEKGRMNKLTEYTWLTDDTISKGSWCYTQGLTIKSLPQVLHVLIDIVSKNGQLILNISPKADGTIPGVQKDVLTGIGDWLKQYGEAIYNTRPWYTFGEGPTRLKKGGGFTHKHGGFLQYSARDIRFTTNGDTLYATLLGKPKGRSVTIKSLAQDSGYFGGKVKEVKLLGHEGNLEFSQDDTGLHVTMPASAPSELANVLMVRGLQIEGFKPDMSIRFKGDNKARLDVSMAELHGPIIGVENKDGGNANIGFWDDPSAWASWQVRFPEAGTYEVHGRFAGPRAAEVKIQVGHTTLIGSPPVTGAWDKFETCKLGIVKVPQAGSQEVKAVPVKKGWNAVNLSFLEFNRIP